VVNISKSWIVQYVVSITHDKPISRLSKVPDHGYKTTLTPSKKQAAERGVGINFEILIPGFGWCEAQSWSVIIEEKVANEALPSEPISTPIQVHGNNPYFGILTPKYDRKIRK
jgi:hypothetical protein